MPLCSFRKTYYLLEMVIFYDFVVKVEYAMFVGVEILAGGAGNIAAARIAGAVSCPLGILFWLESATVFRNFFVSGFACSHGNRSFRDCNVCFYAYIY